MKFKLFLVFAWYIIILSHVSHSQSSFKLRGENGFIIYPGVSIEKRISKLDLSLGYSYKGYIDFFLSFFKANGGDVKDLVIVPGISFFLVKQEDVGNVPSVGLVVAYSRYNSVSESIVSIPESVAGSRDTLVVGEKRISSVGLGVTAHKRIGSWKQIFFQPFIDALFYLNSEGWRSSIRCGIIIGSKLKSGIQIFASPRFEIDAHRFFVGTGAGVVI